MITKKLYDYFIYILFKFEIMHVNSLLLFLQQNAMLFLETVNELEFGSVFQ